MVNNFKVYKYVKSEKGFEEIGFKLYKITYLKGKKRHKLRVVINGVISKSIINVLDVHQGYKKVLLGVISDYENGMLNDTIGNRTKRKISLETIKKDFKPKEFNKFKRHLVNIQSEKNRDTLTKFNLINIKV